MDLYPRRSYVAARHAAKGEWVTDTTPHQRRKRSAALVAGSLVAVILATGLGAALASGKNAEPRPPAITGDIHLKRQDVGSGRTVRGELVFENHTSKTKVLLRGCKVDGLYGIGFRASGGYIQYPAFSTVACSPEQEMVARPGTTVYRFKVLATYIECSQSAKHQPPKSSKYWTPLCLKESSGERDIMPPLPVGKYTALFFPYGEWHGPRVKSAVLVVTRTK
jgi:hypothetical protein